MLSLLRTFRRHYLRVSDLKRKLYASGSFGLEIKFDANSVQAQNFSPDEKLTVQFVVLMRRFLNPSDSIYYRKIWALFLKHFAIELSAENIAEIETRIESLTAGYGDVSAFGINLNAESAYTLIAEGEYFGEAEEFRKQLEQILSVPIMRPILLNRFHSYNQEGLLLVSRIFDLLQRIEQCESYKALVERVTPKENRCIYCLSTSGDFTTQEHIFPDSMGNDEFVLPKGFVCKTCNNEALSRLDSALISFPPVALGRVLHVESTRKLPKAEFGNATIEKTRPRHIHWTEKGDANVFTKETEHENGSFEFKFNLESKRDCDTTAVGRALYKIGIGLLAFDFGHEFVCHDKYNAARAFILGARQTPPNRLLYCRNGVKEMSQVSAEYTPHVPGTILIFNLFGAVLVLNLEEHPPLELDQMLAQAGFDYCPI
jgi:HNH endonuclease